MSLVLVNDSASIGGTEYFLGADSTTETPQTDDCIVQPWIDLSGMASTQWGRIHMYEKVNGGTQRVIYDTQYRSLQPQPIVLPSLIVGEGWDISVLISGGVSFTVNWSLRKITGGTFTFTGDSASIGTTEYFLASDSTTKVNQTTECMLQTWLDLSNLATGDQFLFQLYEKVNGSGDTQRQVFEQVFTGAQSELFTHPALLVGAGWECSLKKLAGTDRTINWSLRKLT